VLAKTPPATINAINEAVRKTLAAPAVSGKLLASGALPSASTPQELAALPLAAVELPAGNGSNAATAVIAPSPIYRRLPARSGHSFAPDAPFGMTGGEVEPTLFVGQTEARQSLRIADIRGFKRSSAGSLREGQLLMGVELTLPGPEADSQFPYPA
jgi:hypothetical protein